MIWGQRIPYITLGQRNGGMYLYAYFCKGPPLPHPALCIVFVQYIYLCRAGGVDGLIISLDAGNGKLAELTYSHATGEILASFKWRLEG